ncbi:MAG: hypothetical protein MHPDNHAH_02265 [Anaerolineales bacterium]|nr:hypothetical protein [Anaerolineales bacterium]
MITEPAIEDAAIHNDIPIELYYYGELGLSRFSLENFQKRDPFSNPEQFEKLFTRLDVKGWIEPQHDEGYAVTEMARAGAKFIIMSGDAKLPPEEAFPEIDLERLKVLVKQIVVSNDGAPEPPEKWAIAHRFRVANRASPVLVKIREYLMDLFAYRDDSHLAAARPHFNDAGIVWLTLGAAWEAGAVSAEKLAEALTFRGYDADDYEVALQAAKEIGWLEETESPGAFRISQKGKELREQVEAQTDDYFYAPWSALAQDELDELYDLLIRLRERLREIRKTASDSRF